MRDVVWGTRRKGRVHGMEMGKRNQNGDVNVGGSSIIASRGRARNMWADVNG